MDLQNILSVASIFITAIVTWFLSRKKTAADIRKIQAEAEGQEFKNIEAILTFWKKMVEDLTEQIEDLKQEVIEFTNENKQLKTERRINTEKIEKLEGEVKLLKEALPKPQ